MKRIKRYFKKLSLKRKLKNFENQKKAMLSLVKDGSWDMKDKFFLKLYNENNAKINDVNSKLSSYETR